MDCHRIGMLSQQHLYYPTFGGSGRFSDYYVNGREYDRGEWSLTPLLHGLYNASEQQIPRRSERRSSFHTDIVSSHVVIIPSNASHPKKRADRRPDNIISLSGIAELLR